ncbi:hypothetical protein GJ496_009363 [Pomphorhynchus laevis]|nr:hypothetical protein GJ496_009363 [Pomphorhynchus laevis]
MSLSSGIRASSELASILPKLKSDHTVRIIKIGIEDDKFVLKDFTNCTSSNGLKVLLDKTSPCYLFIRMDYQLTDNFVFLTWIPTKCKVQLKMIYSTAKFEMRTCFGTSQIVLDHHATNLAETEAVKFECEFGPLDGSMTTSSTPLNFSVSI